MDNRVHEEQIEATPSGNVHQRRSMLPRDIALSLESDENQDWLDDYDPPAESKNGFFGLD